MIRGSGVEEAIRGRGVESTCPHGFVDGIVNEEIGDLSINTDKHKSGGLLSSDYSTVLLGTNRHFPI